MKIPLLPLRAVRSVVVAGLSLAHVACAADVETDDPTTRRFDGAEIQQQLERDADAVFFVDLREARAYAFDQTDVDIDFSHFRVQSPAMDGPIPMEDFAQGLGLSLAADAWTMWSSEVEPAYELVSRSAPLEEEEVCDAEGRDCVIVTRSSYVNQPGTPF